MLVLTRKENESIMIGDAIEIKVLDLKENQVKIGIVAPRAPPRGVSCDSGRERPGGVSQPIGRIAEIVVPLAPTNGEQEFTHGSLRGRCEGIVDQ